MFGKGFVYLIYEAASIQRWNDHIRPLEFTEIDKQAHKAIIALLLAKFEEEENKRKIDWKKLIEGLIFEILHRIKLTDIKPTVFHRVMLKKRKELNDWVFKELEQPLRDIERGEFYNRFKTYFNNERYGVFEKRIIQAAHYLATYWEFNIIYHVSPKTHLLENTKIEIESKIEDHYDLIGVQRIYLKKKSFTFLDLCSQLRFQQRWAQTPRVPKTSVLGHMLIVAILTYVSLLELEACKNRLVYSFYAALFHDLPEVITRDIVSPVKRSVTELEEIIKEYELLQIEEKILPLLPSRWHDEFRYILGIYPRNSGNKFEKDEFKSRIRKNGNIEFVSTSEINKFYNRDEYKPIDGEIMKVCDDLAAYVEAVLSIKYGLSSSHLVKGKESLEEKYSMIQPVDERLDFSSLFYEIGEEIS